MSWILDPGLAEKLLFKMRIDTQRTQLRVCIFVIIFFRFLKWTIATVLQLYIYEDVCYIWKINNCKQKVYKEILPTRNFSADWVSCLLIGSSGSKKQLPTIVLSSILSLSLNNFLKSFLLNHFDHHTNINTALNQNADFSWLFKLIKQDEIYSNLCN